MIYLNGGKHLYLPECNQIINSEIKDIFLKNKIGKEIELIEEDIDQEYIKNKARRLSYLIFEVTQNCNLRCKYCAYSGIYFYEKERNNKNMSLETAQKGLEYIFNYTKDTNPYKEFTIGFYGGEPYFNFELVEEIVKFSKGLFKGWDVEYTVTTNATLLTDEMIGCLIENDFITFISLDGPLESNDAKRVNSDGRGTYETIIGSLERIRKMNEDFYNEKVSIISTFSRDLSLLSHYEFFTTNELVNSLNIRDSQVTTRDTAYYERYPYDKKKLAIEYDQILDTIIDKNKNDEQLHPLEKNVINNYSSLESALNGRNMKSTAGSCMFDQRLMIDVAGKFHICDKINDKFPFGDVHRGFDFKMMSKYANEFVEEVKNKCSHCDIRYLCTPCFIHFAENGKFRISEEMCKERVNNTVKRLERYIKLKENNVL